MLGVRRRLRSAFGFILRMQVWAVTIERRGVHWFDAEVVRITKRNVMVRYYGELARLDRTQLWHWWAFWRGVRFVSAKRPRYCPTAGPLVTSKA